MAVQPRLASAVMLLRDMTPGQGIEVFMVRRVIQSDFAPDVFVFPGGSVSADDRAAEQAEQVFTPVAPGKADPKVVPSWAAASGQPPSANYLRRLACSSRIAVSRYWQLAKRM